MDARERERQTIEGKERYSTKNRIPIVYVDNDGIMLSGEDDSVVEVQRGRAREEATPVDPHQHGAVMLSWHPDVHVETILS